MDYKILKEAIYAAKKPVFFTGAGVSTLCGIPDFRGENGIYRNLNCERMFDIDTFERDPSCFYSLADELVYGNADTKPGPVHLALKKLEEDGKCAGIITQNIDALHERAGSKNVFAVHGSAAYHHCRKCNHKMTFDEIQKDRKQKEVPHCPKCGGVMKPDITFFGEMLPEEAFSGATLLAKEADLIVVLGSSLVVSPANYIPLEAVRNGGKIAIVNRGETMLDSFAFFRGDDLLDFANTIIS